MKYLYYPGCSLKGTAREYDESFRAVAPVLGIEFDEVENWGCCGATVAKSVDRDLSEKLPEKAILQASKAGRDLLMLCPTSSLSPVSTIMATWSGSAARRMSRRVRRWRPPTLPVRPFSTSTCRPRVAKASVPDQPLIG